MATIVRDNLNQKLYVLVGAGFSDAKISRPHALLSDARSSISSESEMVAVANVDGEIVWFPSYQRSVVSVDGSSCRDLIENAFDR
jgi:hypothetical protein